MIEYKNKNNRELIKIISDYIAIQSFDPNVEGIFLCPFFKTSILPVAPA